MARPGKTAYARKYKKGKAPFDPDRVRNIIQAVRIVDRLQRFFFGEKYGQHVVVMTREQIRAAEILLSKCVPNLVAAEMTANVVHRYVAELPPMLNKEEWLKKYQNEMPMTVSDNDRVLELPCLPKPTVQ